MSTRWQPNPGPQTQFLASTAHEVLYGGAAGGGKTAGLVAMPLRWVNNPNFRAITLRRTMPQLIDVIDKATALWSKVFPGSRYNENKKVFSFPSGAKVHFGHIEHEKHISIYDGHEYQLVQFDELTHFTEAMYRRLRARIRSAAAGLPR